MHRSLKFSDLKLLVVCVQAYEFENLSLDLKLVRTNFPPRTIVRGPGFINSVMIIEQVPARPLPLCCSSASFRG